MPRLDPASIRDDPGRKDELDLQLEWHCRHDNTIPMKKDLTPSRKGDKIEDLVAAVERHNTKLSAIGMSHNVDSRLHNDFN